MFASLKDEFIHANEFTFLYFIDILTYCILLSDIILDLFIYKLKKWFTLVDLCLQISLCYTWRLLFCLCDLVMIGKACMLRTRAVLTFSMEEMCVAQQP